MCHHYHGEEWGEALTPTRLNLLSETAAASCELPYNDNSLISRADRALEFSLNNFTVYM